MAKAILQIKNSEGKLLAKLDCAKGRVVFLGARDERFDKFLTENLERGIPVFSDEFNLEKNTSVVGRRIVRREEVEPYMLRDFLRRGGYRVTEKHPEVKEEIKRLLRDISDENSDKKAILEKLPDLSYLEQTTILAELQKLEKEN